MSARLLTYQDLSDKTQIPVSTLKTWASRSPDSLPPRVKIGRMIRFHEDTVDRWLKAKDAKGQKLYGQKA